MSSAVQTIFHRPYVVSLDSVGFCFVFFHTFYLCLLSKTSVQAQDIFQELNNITLQKYDLPVISPRFKHAAKMFSGKLPVMLPILGYHPAVGQTDDAQLMGLFDDWFKLRPQVIPGLIPAVGQTDNEQLMRRRRRRNRWLDVAERLLPVIVEQVPDIVEAVKRG